MAVIPRQRDCTWGAVEVKAAPRPRGLGRVFKRADGALAHASVEPGRFPGRRHPARGGLDQERRRSGVSVRHPPHPEALLRRQREATEVLQRKTDSIIPHVFHHDGRPIRDYYSAWHTACREAKLGGRIPHDFRRTAVRNLERAGVPRSTATRVTGHKTEAVYRRYAIVDSAMLREGVVKLAAFHSTPTAPATVVSMAEAPEGDLDVFRTFDVL